MDLVRLMIYQTNFPDKVLRPNWYNEKKSVKSLDILECGVEFIAKNAFNMKQFEMVDRLSFISNPAITFENGALNGLPHLERLVFCNGSIANTNYIFLEPIAMSMHLLAVAQSSTPTNWYNLIGSIVLPKLHQISFVSIEAFPKIITPNSFTKIPNIELIYLLKCGIEAIMPHSFDHLANSIYAVNLRGNHLKTLPGNLFDKLTRMVFDDSLYVENPWQCTSDLIRLSVKCNCHFEFDCNDEFPDSEMSDETSLLNGDKSVWNKQKCANHYGTNALRINFTTIFNLKKVERDKMDYLYIKGSKRILFYLLVLWRTNDDAIKATIETRCIYLTSKYAAIPPMNTEANSYFACALDDKQSIKVWPLNCFSFSIKANNSLIDYRVIVGLGLCYFIMFWLSLLCGAYLAQHGSTTITYVLGVFNISKLIILSF